MNEIYRKSPAIPAKHINSEWRGLNRIVSMAHPMRLSDVFFLHSVRFFFTYNLQVFTIKSAWCGSQNDFIHRTGGLWHCGGKSMLSSQPKGSQVADTQTSRTWKKQEALQFSSRAAWWYQQCDSCTSWVGFIEIGHVDSVIVELNTVWTSNTRWMRRCPQFRKISKTLQRGDEEGFLFLIMIWLYKPCRAELLSPGGRW